MLQAQMNRDAIGIEEALSYLRACHFSTPKAIEIFKNYQVRLYPPSLPPALLAFKIQHICGFFIMRSLYLTLYGIFMKTLKLQNPDQREL